MYLNYQQVLGFKRGKVFSFPSPSKDSFCKQTDLESQHMNRTQAHKSWAEDFSWKA